MIYSVVDIIDTQISVLNSIKKSPSPFFFLVKGQKIQVVIFAMLYSTPSVPLNMQHLGFERGFYELLFCELMNRDRDVSTFHF